MSPPTSTTSSAAEGEAQQGTLIPGLPDDVGVNCIARVPRWYHGSLSAVSRPMWSLLHSPHLFAARSLLHSAEHFLYLSLRSHLAPSSFFSLYPAPSHQHQTNGQVLVPVPPLPAPAVGSAYAAVGHTIYVLGGSISDVPSSAVYLLDCRFHTWRRGPSMRVAREFAAAGVVDGKLYVMGGCVVDSWAEVLDPEAGRWEAVPSPIEFRNKWMHASVVLGGRVYAMADRGGVVLDPKSRSWDAVDKRLDLGWRGRACVVDKRVYCYDYLGKIRGFDSSKRVWKEVKGVEKGLPKFLCGATMANLGEKLVVLWEGKENGKQVDIWCAQIQVEVDDKNGELWGTLDWSRRLLSVPKGSYIVNCLAVSL